mmetsp:Transcript_97035/g.172719  ORF Transcript_97035/g.172719 Transcript_97035/m.172719 type:complete len:99 (+) Transcript_97035:343-639(+)
MVINLINNFFLLHHYLMSGSVRVIQFIQVVGAATKANINNAGIDQVSACMRMCCMARLHSAVFIFGPFTFTIVDGKMWSHLIVFTMREKPFMLKDPVT